MARKKVVLEEYERTKSHVHKHPKPVSAVLATTIATLAELGLLTQGSLGYLVELTAPKIFAIMEKEGYVRRGMDHKELVKKAMEFLGFDEGSYEMEDNGNELKLRVITEKCVLDPKSVGGVELKGTLCPLPFMLASFLMINDNKDWEVVAERKGAHVYVVRKEDGKCEMTLKVA